MKSKDRFLWVWIAVPIVAVVATVVVLALLREGDPGFSEAGVTLEEIADEPDQWFGESVTADGDVGEVLGPRSFLLTERFTASDLLVINPVPLWKVGEQADGEPLSEGELSEDQLVRVTGEVVRFDIASAERRIGADLDEETLDAYVGTPAIIADSISLEPPDVFEEDALRAPGEG